MTEQVEELSRQFFKRQFDVFDVDKLGRVPVSRLYSLLRVCGMTPSNEDRELLEKEADEDNNGAMKFPGFYKVALMCVTETHSPEVVMEAFRHFDWEEKGFMSESMIRYILTTMGEPFSVEEMNAFIEEMRSETDIEGNFVFTDMVCKMAPEFM